MATEQNPFKGINRARKERIVIPAGIYTAHLSSVKTVKVTDKKTGEKRDKLLFSFQVPEKGEVCAFFWPSHADTSHLIKFLKTVGGGSLTPAIQADPDKMWQFVQDLCWKDYQIVVTLTNGWNNIETALPVATKPAPRASEDITVDFSNDEIPF